MNIDLKSYINEYGITVCYTNGYSLAIAEACSILIPNNITCKDTMYFNRIHVPIDMESRGIGSRLLDSLLYYIKEADSALRCDINPYGRLNYVQLEEWYIRHGFKKYLGESGNELWYNT